MRAIPPRLLLRSTVASLMLCSFSIVILNFSFDSSNVLSAQLNVQEFSSPRHLASASLGTNCSSSDLDRSIDWFDKERWREIKSPLMCFYAENICHGAEKFFYDARSRGHGMEQPRWEIKRSGKINHGYWYDSPGYSIDIGVEEMAGQEQQNCFYSPLQNHIVLHGAHNSMLGEFYARVLPGLKHNMDAFATGEDQRKWQEGTQLYLDAWKSLPYYYYGPMENLLDSHRLFLRPFTSNPVLQLRSLQDNTGCSCIKRLSFAGMRKSTKPIVHQYIYLLPLPRNIDISGSTKTSCGLTCAT